MLLDRKDMIRKRLSLDDETFSLYNKKIYDTLMNDIDDNKRIGIYVSYKNEVDTLSFITHYKGEICVPKIIHNDMNFYLIDSLNELEKGYFGVLEPYTNHIVDINSIDIMIIPLLYYDKNFYRMGYGKGFYDKALKDYQGLKIGLAYSFQEVEDIHPHALDIPLDMIINENQILFSKY